MCLELSSGCSEWQESSARYGRVSPLGTAPARKWGWLIAVLLLGWTPVVLPAWGSDQKVIIIEGEQTDEGEESTDKISVSFGGRGKHQRIIVRGSSVDSSGRSKASNDWELQLDLEGLEKNLEELDDQCFGGPMSIEGDDVVAFGRDITVASGKIVPGSVVCIIGSAHIHGTVKGDVVAIGGHVDVAPGAVIYGETVAVGGGNISVADGAVIHGEAVTVGGRVRKEPHALIGKRVEIAFIPSFGHGFGAAGIGWLGFFSHLVFVGLVGWVLLLLSRKRWSLSIATLRLRGWESLLAGVGGGIVYTIVIIPLLLVLAVTMVAIVVGIPLVPVLVLLFLTFPIPGYLVTCSLLGLTVIGGSGRTDPTADSDDTRPEDYPTRGLGGAFFLGHLLLSLPGLVGLLLVVSGGGGMVSNLFLLLSFAVINLAIALGWGSFLLSRFGRRAPAA
ncbi:MAG: hypothetical protein KAY24_00485 [Candidatus Eisenbacteria sp.]|nr:hypothetical protein [Candidatus Eisenbacteria bacterium]